MVAAAFWSRLVARLDVAGHNVPTGYALWMIMGEAVLLAMLVQRSLERDREVQRSAGIVERDEESVALMLDLAASVRGDAVSHDPIVPREQAIPIAPTSA